MRFFTALIVGFVVASGAAMAQTTTQTFTIGGGNLQLAPDQKTMFDAQKAFAEGDYREANTLYSQAIALNGNNIDAYLQRAAVRRELGNAGGMQEDANMVIDLSNQKLQTDPRNPNLYYERGMGYRLLKQYDKAKADIAKGMRIGGKANWETDLKAIDLERKYAE